MADLMQQARELLAAEIGAPVTAGSFVGTLPAGVHSDAAIRAIAAALRAAPEWQPMETAPRDGTVVLVAIGGSDIPQPCRFRDRVGWVIAWDEWRIPAHDGPLGWMPLPSAARPQGVK